MKGITGLNIITIILSLIIGFVSVRWICGIGLLEYVIYTKGTYHEGIQVNGAAMLVAVLTYLIPMGLIRYTYWVRVDRRPNSTYIMVLSIMGWVDDEPVGETSDGDFIGGFIYFVALFLLIILVGYMWGFIVPAMLLLGCIYMVKKGIDASSLNEPLNDEPNTFLLQNSYEGYCDDEDITAGEAIIGSGWEPIIKPNNEQIADATEQLRTAEALSTLRKKINGYQFEQKDDEKSCIEYALHHIDLDELRNIHK